MFMLKLVKSPVSAATCNVRVAATIAPAAIVLPCLFHSKVSLSLAVVGIHDDVVMLKVAAVLPMFLM